MQIRKYQETDLPEMTSIWNKVVEDGIAFPQEECLTEENGGYFFASQNYTGVAENDGKIVGLYILHPNNVGRCGHICNASYAVSSACRGQHIGEKLVLDCLKTAKELPCPASVRATGVCSAWNNPRRIQDEERAL